MTAATRFLFFSGPPVDPSEPFDPSTDAPAPATCAARVTGSSVACLGRTTRLRY
jgi:hypothetical protein